MMNDLWKQERLTDEWPKECSTDFLTGKAKMLADGIRDIIDENLHLRPTIRTAQYDYVPSDERLAEIMTVVFFGISYLVKAKRLGVLMVQEVRLRSSLSLMVITLKTLLTGLW